MKQNKLQAFLDDTRLMTIIVDQKYYHNEFQLSVYENKKPVAFKKCNEILYDQVYKLSLKVEKEVNLRDDWKVTLDESLEAEVLSGKVVRSDAFIKANDYQGDDLGFQYKPTHTIFKLWAPIAKKVHLLIEDLSHQKKSIELSYDKQGVWMAKINQDLEGFSYYYNVYVNGGWKKVKDPYAIASKANGEASFIINDEKTFKMTNEQVHVEQPIIYEVSVRDFTADVSANFKYNKSYLGMIESDKKTPHQYPIGFDYIQSLGITHIQLMPIFDFTGIDELNPENAYNWGYNPSQYFVPEGSYATKADDPYARIDEVKKMIDTYHSKQIGIIMDVVYNHVDAYKKFPYEILVPGYSFRVDKQEIMTDFSGCGNDLNTSRPMIRKLIIDSLIRWASFYKMDGFRFDLMGLIDVKTMNIIQEKLTQINPEIMLYGEGWQMDDNDSLAHMNNPQVSKQIGFFNDLFRDSIKGSTFNLIDKGFALGNMDYQTQVDAIFTNRAPIAHKQSINYVECHDNHTFYDKAMTIFENDVQAQTYQLLATCLTILAPGTPFLHLGQEFYRSKSCVGNSYNVSDDINQIIWYDVERYWESIQVIQAFIQFRKKLKSYAIDHMEWFDEGFYFTTKNYTIYVLVKESEIEIPNHLNLILSSTHNHQKLKDVGIYIYERKSTC
jgi:pullulanase